MTIQQIKPTICRFWPMIPLLNCQKAGANPFHRQPSTPCCCPPTAAHLWRLSVNTSACQCWETVLRCPGDNYQCVTTRHVCEHLRQQDGSKKQPKKKTKKTKPNKPRADPFQSGALMLNCWKDPDSVVTKLSPAFNEGCWWFREEQACIMGVYFWQLSSWQLMTELMVFLLFIDLSVLIRGFRYKTAVTARPHSWKHELACCGYSRFPPNAKKTYF